MTSGEIDGLLISEWEPDRTACVLSTCLNQNLAKVGVKFLGPGCALLSGMHPKAVELQARTQRFAAAVIKFCDGLPQDGATQRIVLQLVDACGATDSNYRATCRARSTSEFIAKIGVALEEADESKGWLQLLVASNRAAAEQAAALIQEADELVSIFAKSRKTAQSRKAEHDQQQKLLRNASRRRSK